MLLLILKLSLDNKLLKLLDLEWNHLTMSSQTSFDRETELVRILTREQWSGPSLFLFFFFFASFHDVD